MTCFRCHGLLVPETVHDGARSKYLYRCINCGWYGQAEGSAPMTDCIGHCDPTLQSLHDFSAMDVVVDETRCGFEALKRTLARG